MGNLSQRCRRKRVPAREGGSVFKFLLDRVDAIIDGVRQLAAAWSSPPIAALLRCKAAASCRTPKPATPTFRLAVAKHATRHSFHLGTPRRYGTGVRRHRH